jgi:chaperonin cofactor prefoldin
MKSFFILISGLCRSQVSELKKQNHELLERVHHLQNEVTDSDMRRHELENQLRNANTVGFEDY